MGTVRSVQRSWRSRAPTPRVCLVQAGVGQTLCASPKTRGSVQTAPDDTPRLPFVSTRRWPNDRTVPTPRPAAAMMTCNGRCGGRRMLGDGGLWATSNGQQATGNVIEACCRQVSSRHAMTRAVYGGAFRDQHLPCCIPFEQKCSRAPTHRVLSVGPAPSGAPRAMQF